MAVRIQFDPSMARLATGLEELEVPPGTIKEALVAVARRFPLLQSRLFNCEGEMRTIVRLRRNGEPADAAGQVSDGDTLLLTLA